VAVVLSELEASDFAETGFATAALSTGLVSTGFAWTGLRSAGLATAFFGGAALAALVLPGAAFETTVLADAFSAGLVAVVGSTTGPRAAEFFLTEAAREFVAPFDSFADGVFAPFFSGAFAEVDAALAVDVFTAAVFAAAAAVRTEPADFVGALMDGAVFAAALEGVLAEFVDLLALLPVSPERRDAAVTLAAFVFSFFLADGIRRALLLRPAVETGRITDRPTPGSFRSRQAGLWF
jgi:hypothetical protein